MSKDGGARLENFAKDDERYDKDSRHYYDVDFTNPNAERIVQDIDPLAMALLPEDLKLKSDLTGYLYNAVNTGDQKTEQQHIKELYGDFFGLNKQDPQGTILATLEDRFNNGLITKDQYDVAKNSVNRVFGYPTFGV
jgi:predicted RNA-binding protein associated with RNAse of E/G family